MLFVDAAHFVLSSFLGWVWSATRLFVRGASGRQRYNVLGAVNPLTQELIRVCNQTYINSHTVCELLHQIAALGLATPITLVLDNAAYQRCQLVRNVAQQLNIELLFLPSYSPNLNLIERLWKFVKKQALHSRHHTNYADFQAATDTCLDQLNTTHKPAVASLLTLKFQTFQQCAIAIRVRYSSPNRAWWCVAAGACDVVLYERWLTMKTWLPRIVRAIEQHAPNLPRTVLIEANFEGVVEDGKSQPIPSADEIRKSVSWSVDHHANSIKVTVGTAFELGMQAPTNLSEAILVSELCSAVLELARVSLTGVQLEALQRRIVPNEHARHLHAFQARSFRDFVGATLQEAPIELDDIDSAALRIGLAFRVEPREKGRFFDSEQTTIYETPECDCQRA